MNFNMETDPYQLNTSGDINLGDSRLDTGLNNHEIENVVMQHTQSQLHNASQNMNF